MPPAKPLPMVVPVTSTNWPGTKCAAVSSAPTSSSASAATRNSTSLLLRLDLRLGEVAAHRLGDVLDLGLADAELDGGVAVLLLGAHGHDLAVVELQHGHRHVLAVVVEERVMPSFCAIRPVRMTHASVP